MWYSQNKQDQFLEKTVFKGFKNGVFIDVGAHDGKSINNTLFFEINHGWSGVNIEPLKNIYDKLVLNRPNCINLNCAVSDQNGFLDFYYNTDSFANSDPSKSTEMLSGLKDYYHPKHKTRLELETQKKGGVSNIIQVPTKTIKTICEEHKINHVHLLSVDVEGAEFQVIKSIDFNSVFIDVIVFENNYIDASIPIIQYLQNKDYIILRKAEDIYMIHKQSQFFTN